jgi:hypothetical protein
VSSKIWKIPLNPNKEKSEDEVYKETFIQSIFHPSYVYAGKLIPTNSTQQRFVIITGCFDGKLRIYQVSIEGGMIQAPGRPLLPRMPRSVIHSRRPRQRQRTAHRHAPSELHLVRRKRPDIRGRQQGHSSSFRT